MGKAVVCKSGGGGGGLVSEFIAAIPCLAATEKIVINKSFHQEKAWTIG